MSLKLIQNTIKILKEEKDKKFTARELSKEFLIRFPNQCQKKRRQSPRIVDDSDLERQIAAEIGSSRPQIQKKCPFIKTSEGRPRKYFYDFESDINEPDSKSPFDSGNSRYERLSCFKEYDMYPKLCSYLMSEFNVHSKRIDEKRSSNSDGNKGNHWLFPDLVGIENLSLEWDREVKECVKHCHERRCKFWSFEVKRRINRSNVRQVFFQAVSNSTWSHFGYIVTSDLEGANTLKELQILSSRHGIGLIKLDFENPSESQLMIPARERSELDWDHINRLTVENKDFKEFIKNIRHFHQTGDLRDKDWDPAS